MKIADKTIFGMVLIAVQVGFVVFCFAMGDCFVVMFKNMVQLFQGNYLKDQCCQKKGGKPLIFGIQFQKFILI
ncbi:MAG: hypothetical protein IPN76_33075 [Saprospiraceae bacterium]|nr:hypothetical protein [Saprospiraceae bacterium]